MYAIKLREHINNWQQLYQVWENKPASWQLEKAKKLRNDELEKAEEYRNKIAYYQKKLINLAREALK